MRELKFRAWDKDNKRWIKCAYLLTSGIDEYFSIIGVQGDSDEELLIPDEVEVVWYTGLKDENGTEIYEGDIVCIRKDRFGDGKNEVWTIQWECAGFGVYNQLNSSREIEEGGMECDGFPCFTTDGEEYFRLEVIGNIYEGVNNAGL